MYCNLCDDVKFSLWNFHLFVKKPINVKNIKFTWDIIVFKSSNFSWMYVEISNSHVEIMSFFFFNTFFKI